MPPQRRKRSDEGKLLVNSDRTDGRAHANIRFYLCSRRDAVAAHLIVMFAMTSSICASASVFVVISTSATDHTTKSQM